MSYSDQSPNDTPSSEGAWQKLSQVAVKGAEYNSRERQPHPKCLKGTRVDLLNHIYGLLDDTEKSRLVWLHGGSGVGKSPVAFTVAERMRGLKVKEQTTSEKRLAGTFFFSHNHTKRSTTGYFFATLGYQLAINFPSIRDDVKRAIHENPALLDPDKSLPDQMEALFLQPLRGLQLRLRQCPPVVFVVGALDECTSKAEIVDLISLLAQALRAPDLPVTHILLTSCLEPHIHNAFLDEEVHPLVCEIKFSEEGIASVISLDGADVNNVIYVPRSQHLRFGGTSQSSSHSLQPASGSQDLQRSSSSQNVQAPAPDLGRSDQRPRANSAGNSQRPVVVFPQPQVQTHVPQHVVQRSGFQYSKCTGGKKALCIGINYKGQQCELRGCINDANNMKRVLISNWNYRADNTMVLTDDTNYSRQMPTRRNILDGLHWLVRDARPNDALFFHYSGHGGHEATIYPVDYKRAGMIIDDEMHYILVKSLPVGCRLTAVFDSLYSSQRAILDLPYTYHSTGCLTRSHITAQALAQATTAADVISFTRCRSNTTSPEAIQGAAVGIMSYAFITSLTSKPIQSYQELLESVEDIMKQNSQQEPLLSSSHPIDTNLRFIL
ncbi:hypothetical protein K503DRAFT_394422 [Rhizopogon vinicolor AM-OR11-026]|uniref:Peptidase C14 n=1 Tax=Rhizopogon vinicolor AM-OR11-026 TaxID=1314800 RepID=A0A1B7NBF7_9AGAM|nr:hypothetical protein K503DRAFT_394422 [Rhizopogon vinicolor AM-OR11-026]